MDQPKNFVDVINTKLNCQPRHFDEKNRLKLNHRFHAAIITEKSRFNSQKHFCITFFSLKMLQKLRVSNLFI